MSYQRLLFGIYLDERIAKRIAIPKNKIPNTVVALIKKASNPRALVLTVPSSPPPVNELAALLLDGCITTDMINKIETIINAINSALYSDYPPLKISTINRNIKSLQCYAFDQNNVT